MAIKKLNKKATTNRLAGKSMDELRQMDKQDWSREELVQYAKMLTN